MNIVDNTRKFLKETEIEARKIIWPNRKYVFAATVIILAIVFLSSVYVLIVDFGFSKIFDFIMLSKGNF